ncbi:MAG: prolipoprotein diacylglyceryl transferase [Treponema sp.]|nr:prolipoprotein diacylglyceryl transferase [Treponema sp.]
MFPNITIFGRDIGLFAIMALCGIFSSGIYASAMAKRRSCRDPDIIIFMLFLSIGIVVGGSLLHAIVTIVTNGITINAIVAYINAAGLLPVLAFIFGGTVFYGGLIGGLTVGWICVRKNSGYSNHVDILAVCIPLFHFFGRIGCFLGGCCFGIESTLGFTFRHSPIEVANGISRFPVQLLEALFNIGLFFLLDRFLRTGRFKNRLVFVYLLIYSTGRFFIEFLRGDEHRGVWVFLSTSQIISVVIFSSVLVWLYISHRRKPREAVI